MKHKHDCNKCEFIDTIEGSGDWSGKTWDLHVCEETIGSDMFGPVFIARYGSEGSEYLSCNDRTLEMMKTADNFNEDQFQHYRVMIARARWKGNK